MAGDTRSAHRRVLWLAPLLLPFAFAGGLFVSVVMALIIPPFVFVGLYSEFRLRRRYRRAGQMCDWTDVCRRLEAGDGTLIVSIAPKGPRKLWWAGSDLGPMFNGCPLPPAKAFVTEYGDHYTRLHDAAN